MQRTKFVFIATSRSLILSIVSTSCKNSSLYFSKNSLETFSILKTSSNSDNVGFPSAIRSGKNRLQAVCICSEAPTKNEKRRAGVNSFLIRFLFYHNYNPFLLMTSANPYDHRHLNKKQQEQNLLIYLYDHHSNTTK